MKFGRIWSSDDLVRPLLCSAEAGAAGGEGEGAGGEGGKSKGAAAAGDGSENGQGEEGKTFTQAELNRILGKERADWNKKFNGLSEEKEAMRGELGTMRTELTTLQELLNETAAEAEQEIQGKASEFPELDEIERELQIPAGIKDPKAWIAIKKASLIEKRRVAKLEQQLAEQADIIKSTKQLAEDERKRREEADTARANALRDNQLASALTKANCIDIEGALMIIAPKVKWSDKHARFVYFDRNNEAHSLEEGVAMELEARPHFIRAVNGDGGAGSGGGRGPGLDDEIRTAEAQVQEAEARQKANPSDSNIAVTRAAKRTLEQKKKEKESRAARV